MNMHASKNSDTFRGVNGCLLGAHFSIAEGLHGAILEADRRRCNALQIFTKNASTWKERNLTDDEIERFHRTWQQSQVKEIASHTSYLINLASPEKPKNAMSRKALGREMIRSHQLGLQYVIQHPGAHMQSGATEGIQKIIAGLNAVFEAVPDATPRLLIETTAGQGSSLGHTFEQLAAILEGVQAKDRIGVCYDTCHTFAAGYDIRDEGAYQKTMDLFDNIIGLDHLYLMHLNDSKKGLGLRVDRHEHIGLGAIGEMAFELIINDPRFCNVPKLLETAKEKDGRDWDDINLNKLRGMVRQR